MPMSTFSRSSKNWQKGLQHELEMGRSPLDVQQQMRRTTLTMRNHYASLTTEHLRKSQERFSPLRAKGGAEIEGSSSGYWDE